MRGFNNFYGGGGARNWYEHRQALGTDIGLVTLLWNFKVHANRTIETHVPDTVIKDRVRTFFLMDMAVSEDFNVDLEIFKIQGS